MQINKFKFQATEDFFYQHMCHWKYKNCYGKKVEELIKQGRNQGCELDTF